MIGTIFAFLSGLLIGFFFSDWSLYSSLKEGLLLILPQYKEYIQNDQNLDESSKKIRRRHADVILDLINEKTEE